MFPEHDRHTTRVSGRLLTLVLCALLAAAASARPASFLGLPHFSLAPPGKLKPVAATPVAATPVEVRFAQVQPASREGGPFVRRPAKDRAVVLIHGFWYHLNQKNVAKAEFKEWQLNSGLLVKTLAPYADVFAFAYGQSVPLEQIAAHPAFADGIRKLRDLGYSEIVLLGHSAGGLIARHFVEDNPQAGVTKIIQVCSPNGGCALAKTKFIHSNQKPFADSLTEETRSRVLKERAAIKVPAPVEFVCVVGCGTGNAKSDGVVNCGCQWTNDLQEQSIPAVRLVTTHRKVMREALEVRTLAELVRTPQPRWDLVHVEAMRKLLREK
jgi:pimeloyl-ACP methyl ester carboxylesterase